MKRWRVIIDYPDYEISDHGDVISHRRGRKSKYLKPAIVQGYPRVLLYNKPYKGEWFSVHILVAVHFVPNPENKPDVDHWDRDRGNPYYENLRWATKKENANNLSPFGNCHNKSGFRGVSFHKGRWRGVLHVEGKHMHVGYFDTPQQANDELIRLRGDI